MAAGDYIKRQMGTAHAIFSAGGSVTPTVDLAGFSVAALILPDGWTTAALTFQAAPTAAGTYRNVYDDVGNEASIPSNAGSRVIGVDALAGVLAPLRHIKLRSGTNATPVNQVAAGTVTLLLKG